ncbi:MAG: hypothetical protein ACO1NX_02485 [Chitinophagaceae bacterium]
MKKRFAFFAVACAALFITSCEKIENALFKPFESPLNFEITIPAISSTTAESNMGQTNVRYNLDSVIKKHTENVFGADIVGAMYINQIGVQLLDNNGGNLGNFDYVKLSVSTGGTPAVLGPYNIPSGATSSASFTVSNSPNIKPFFSGSTVTFSMLGKANTPTTQPLRARISATIRFEK